MTSLVIAAAVQQFDMRCVKVSRLLLVLNQSFKSRFKLIDLDRYEMYIRVAFTSKILQDQTGHLTNKVVKIFRKYS